MCLQSLPLKMKYQLFTIASELSVPEVTFYGIELSNEPLDVFSQWTDWKKCRWCLDEEPGPFPKTAHRLFGMKYCWISQNITLYCVSNRSLKVQRGKIPPNRIYPELVKNGGYVAVLKLDGCFGPINFASQYAIVLCFVER